jgi:hypothetical protein
MVAAAFGPRAVTMAEGRASAAGGGGVGFVGLLGRLAEAAAIQSEKFTTCEGLRALPRRALVAAGRGDDSLVVSPARGNRWRPPPWSPARTRPPRRCRRG